MKFKNPLSRQKFYRMTVNGIPDMALEILLYAACFFPFVQIVYIGTDTQPYGVLLSFLVVVVCWLRRAETAASYTVVMLACIIMSVSGIVLILNGNVYAAFRSVFTYMTLIFVPLAVCVLMERRGGLNEGLAKLCIWLWFLVGFMQRYVQSDFGYSLLSRHTTNEVRGAVGLAAEPSAYGYMCMFFALIALRFRKHAKFYALNAVIQAVVFATSSVTLVYMAVYIVLYMVNELVMKKKYSMLKTVVAAGGGIAGLLFIQRYFSSGNRMGALVEMLFHNPEKLLKDESIVMRVDAITYSFQGFFENHFLPRGLSEQKIMSGIGGLFYECGFLAIVILTAVAVIIWKSYPEDKRILYTGGFLLMMFSSIPFSAPIVGFYLGHCLYEMRKQEQRKAERAVRLKDTGGRTVWYCGKLYRERQDESIVDL